MSEKTPTDYTKDDGWNEERGTEHCPHCDKRFSGEGGYHENVFDQAGREYEYFLNTDPANGPFFCPGCWNELETNQKASENKSIEEYV